MLTSAIDVHGLLMLNVYGIKAYTVARAKTAGCNQSHRTRCGGDNDDDNDVDDVDDVDDDDDDDDNDDDDDDDNGGFDDVTGCQ